MNKIKVKIKKPWIGYPGSTLQNTYAESIDRHGYLLWDIKQKGDWDVTFHELPNVKPFVTLDWAGDVDTLVSRASEFPRSSRFRIRSDVHLPHRDVLKLTEDLKRECQASEVTFKIDARESSDVVSSGVLTLAKDDLRDKDVLVRLMRDYFKGSNVTDDEWSKCTSLVESYVQTASANDSTVRNVKWALKRLKFDNLFTYGDGNVVNFDSLSGIVGVFGPNRIGKSSIIGALLYALCNGTDRGSIKNQHVVNVRKSFGSAEALINVSGVDYVVERQTTKRADKRGREFANTVLNLYRISDDKEAIDLAGEQRSDTDKQLRQLVGTGEDFLMTSIAAQGELNAFVSQGSARRHQIVSRFMDINVLHKLHELSNATINGQKVVLKGMPERDWETELRTTNERLAACESAIEQRTSERVSLDDSISVLRQRSSAHVSSVDVVTEAQIIDQRSRLSTLQKSLKQLDEKLSEAALDRETLLDEQRSVVTQLGDVELASLREQRDAVSKLREAVVDLKHSHDREATALKEKVKSLRVLKTVPCGDQFPLCRFISDAHGNKDKIEPLTERVERALARLEEAQASLESIADDSLTLRIETAEKLLNRLPKIESSLAQLDTETFKLSSQRTTVVTDLDHAAKRVDELVHAFENEENIEIISIRSEMDALMKRAPVIDAEKLKLASEVGRCRELSEKLVLERAARDSLLSDMRLHELISNAFSKKGIPSAIVASQLPLINAEISRILAGIVDFSIELECDEESDALEVYIDYGDSRRIIELASGMEKMISSIAIRVALINSSSLPKTNFFVIDEGFDSLDSSGIEACNRLLVSLKRYFDKIIVVTHLDAVKDTADVVIEVSKVEKDAKIVHLA